MVQESLDTQKMVADSVQRFGEKHIAPHRDKWDDEEHFPVEVFHKLGELGLMGILVPEEYGGTGLGYNEYVTAISELAYFDPGIALSLAAHNSLCTNHILMFGNEEQKQKWLPKLASGEWIGAWGLTEPNTGSDAGNMMTVAKKEGNEWVINGSKNFITHGKSGNIAVVMARTGEKGDKHAMTAFVVERGTKGFSGGRKERKLGMRTSETTEMIFEDCRVSEANVLGEVGEGFVQALKILDGGRISIAALGLGIANGALKCAIQYSKERKQFGKSISSFQGISFKLADMATQVEASRLLIKEAIIKKQRGENINKASAMAKYYASEVAVKCADEAVQIFGGYGFTKDYPVEKYYRDAKLCTIGEGTSNIQKLVISRCLLDE
ncbi:acyl-CoA dehydrogenase family protein [Flammeovirga aprica]|uniref:Cyclohex-1-ene-1-carbonyl-CoA dehydrogenase n=1 Tax=Flammeovirga aprica JL-4 TaxID=694437 RepID=A0A7X9NYR2_9BACT|nr:acyl-CoA dehydrogenase family protein [Flammeovirga aprica]NME66371.1 acyl-CoA dehydrogenase [Flammeovirga aprica JL-4]